MTRETTYKGTMGDLERLIAALVANAAELGHLDGARLRMEELLETVRETAQEQAELVAAKQEASRRLLLQIGSDPQADMDWGTGADLAFLINEDALRSADFAQAYPLLGAP